MEAVKAVGNPNMMSGTLYGLIDSLMEELKEVPADEGQPSRQCAYVTCRLSLFL